MKLVEANRGRILRLCRVYAWNASDQEDLYQVILVQIWRSLPGLRDNAVVNTWLYRVALNTAISFVRKQKPGRNAIAMEETHLREWERSQIQSDAVAGQARLDRLYEALDKLSKVEKALVTLHLEDLSYEEIGAVLGLDASHVGVTLHRAKKKLSNLMTEEPA